jgi:hypothetical protein
MGIVSYKKRKDGVMPKPKRTLAGAFGLTKRGWKIVDRSAGSTTLSSALSPEEVKEMKDANTSTGFLSAGSSVFSSAALLGITFPKPASAPKVDKK